MILKLLAKRKFRCSFFPDGCQQVRFYEGLTEHEAYCIFRRVKCHNLDCVIELPENKIKEHQRVCEFNKVPCRHCAEGILLKQRRQHEERCDQAPAVCPGCDFELLRRDLFHHIDVCELVKIECPYCHKQLTRTEMSFHDQIQCLRSEITEFVKGSQGVIADLKKQVQFLLEKIQKKDKYFQLICSICKMFACESQLEECQQCRTQFCCTCSKLVLKNCSECRGFICNSCISCSSDKSKCFQCEEKVKRTTSSSYMLLRSNPNKARHTNCEVRPLTR